MDSLSNIYGPVLKFGYGTLGRLLTETIERLIASIEINDRFVPVVILIKKYLINQVWSSF